MMHCFSPLRSLGRQAVRFCAETRGSLSMEFVLWVPLLSFWMVFTVGVFMSWDSRNDAAKTAYAVSDILSRREEVDAALLAQIHRLADQLAQPVGGRSDLRVTSVIYVDPDGPNGQPGEFQVLWSCAYGTQPPLTTETLPWGRIPPSMAPLDTVLLTELDVPFAPITNLVQLESLVWQNAIVTRPRLTREIALKNNACV